jgi:hypothetical protein
VRVQPPIKADAFGKPFDPAIRRLLKHSASTGTAQTRPFPTIDLLRARKTTPSCYVAYGQLSTNGQSTCPDFRHKPQREFLDYSNTPTQALQAIRTINPASSIQIIGVKSKTRPPVRQLWHGQCQVSLRLYVANRQESFGSPPAALPQAGLAEPAVYPATYPNTYR